MSFNTKIEVLKLIIPSITPIVILILGIIISKKIEKSKLILLKDKEWQVKWAELFFQEAVLFNSLTTESVSLIHKFLCLPKDNIEERNLIINKLSKEKFPMLDRTEWNIKNYIQLSDNKNNIDNLLSLQEDIFKEIDSFQNNGNISFETIQLKQLNYNKLARVIHNEIMNRNN